MSVKLVIVDDAPFIREIVRNIASKHDIQVIGEAENGAEAIEVVLKLRPDVVLMDLVMPEKTGIEAISEITKALPEMKIVAFSTMVHASLVMQAVQAGACDYVYKPFKEDELVRAIHAAAGKSVSDG